MDKPKLKKSVIRNPVLTVPKTVVIKDKEALVPPPTAKLSEKITAPEKSKVSLNEPELNSALHIVKEIESVNNAKLTKASLTKLSHKRHIIPEEKAAKQVNFPHHQKLYKDLIPLCVNTQPQPLPTVARDYQIIKDEEPLLSNFYTPRKLPEYSFKVPIQSSHKTVDKQYDGFKLYRTMRNWN
ncbi:hypothetical protein FQR65_LT01454 [Abscondita terminalis]|nr:hypothetical protein FQR65_LT01454 [Abscondita terminalis]